MSKNETVTTFQDLAPLANKAQPFDPDCINAVFGLAGMPFMLDGKKAEHDATRSLFRMLMETDRRDDIFRIMGVTLILIMAEIKRVGAAWMTLTKNDREAVWAAREASGAAFAPTPKAPNGHATQEENHPVVQQAQAQADNPFAGTPFGH